MKRLPGYLHVYRFRTVERVELKVPCDHHGYWHTFPLQAEYRAGTVIERAFKYQGWEFLTIEVQVHEFDPAWQDDHKNWLTPAYGRFALAALAPA